MYTEVGAFDAKAKLSELLQKVKLGHRYTITVRGRPAADLVPSEGSIQDTHAAIEAMRGINKVRGVSGDSVAEWVAEGRR